MANPDIFVVGGGPAGLATAIAARRKGFTVTVADGVVPPADKACGEGLMPDGIEALHALGIDVPAADSFPFRGITFVDGAASVTADFPGRPGRGVRRTTLHRILIEHAEAAGVRLEWGVRVDFDSIRSRWIVGADGGSSLVRKRAGLDDCVSERRRFGFRRHYAIAPWSDYMELYWSRGCQVYVTPVSPDSVCVAAITEDPHVRLDHVLSGLPGLNPRLRPELILTPERGAVSASRRLKRVCQGRVALVGDASGSVDAITGEGLCLAFRQADALADAFANDDLGAYQSRYRSLARRPALMAKLLLTLGDHSAFRFVAMRAMAAFPPLFTGMLALHVGAAGSDYENNRSLTDADVPCRPENPGRGDLARTRSHSDAGAVHAK